MSTAYRYNHNQLFPRTEPGSTLPHSVTVRPLKHRAVNVTYVGEANFMAASTWDFQIEGGVPGLPPDQWYRTHYDWSLIEDNPPNVARAHYIDSLRQRQQALRIEIESVQGEMAKAKAE